MIKELKTTAIEELKEKFDKYSFFYLTDSSGLTVEKVNQLRRICFEKGVEMKVVKNTLAIKALQSAPESKNYQQIYEAFAGPTAIMFSETANLPASIITEFRDADNTRPTLKGAYIDADIYLGDDQLANLKALKSKEQLIGDILSALQSPMTNVIGALESGKNTIAGLVKTLESRA